VPALNALAPTAAACEIGLAFSGPEGLGQGWLYSSHGTTASGPAARRRNGLNPVVRTLCPSPGEQAPSPRTCGQSAVVWVLAGNRSYSQQGPANRAPLSVGCGIHSEAGQARQVASAEPSRSVELRPKKIVVGEALHRRGRRWAGQGHPIAAGPGLPGCETAQAAADTAPERPKSFRHSPRQPSHGQFQEMNRPEGN